jgi:drug/metabolite transporter (DMT)-like permease
MSQASSTRAGPEPHSRPARARPLLPPGLVLVVAVAAISWAGPLVRFATAPALAIAAWRLIFSVVAVLLILAVRSRGAGLPRLTLTEWLLCLAAGVFLAAHFWSWIASLGLTSVASSVVLVNTAPLFVAFLSAAVLREPPGRRVWLGIVVAIVGAAVIGWGDWGRGQAPLVGDALAVAGAVFVSGYFVLGRRLRQRLDLWTYTAIVYGAAAVVLAVVAAATPEVAMTGYPLRDWLIFLALALGPMLLGHTGINYALRYVPAYVANLAALGEPVGATLIAWLWPALGEAPPVQTVVGGALILLGIGVGVRGRGDS